jgi:Ni,Fe-hydrogenase I cytochrome b subunit
MHFCIFTILFIGSRLTCIFMLLSIYIELASYVLHFRRVLFTMKLLHKCFHFLCSLYLIGRVYVFYVGHVDKSSLYETLFHCNILIKHHHQVLDLKLALANKEISDGKRELIAKRWLCVIFPNLLFPLVMP